MAALLALLRGPDHPTARPEACRSVTVASLVDLYMVRRAFVAEAQVVVDPGACRTAAVSLLLSSAEPCCLPDPMHFWSA